MGSKLICIAQKCNEPVLRRDLCMKHLKPPTKKLKSKPEPIVEVEPLPESKTTIEVYIIGIENRPGLYKFGKTILPVEKRLGQLQTGIPDKLYIVCRGRGCEEAELHEMFWDVKIRGEWFELNKDELRLAKTMVFGQKWLG